MSARYAARGDIPRVAQRALTHQESGLKASLLTLLLAEGRALSDPLPVTSARIERACEAPLAESAARCATRGDIGFFGISFTDIPNGVADGIDEVRKAVREILRTRADWIKLATTGGVLSTSDAPTSSQLTVEEIATAVYEAAAQEKRCMAHAQGTQGIKNALQAGVASIEHGVYLTDELIDMMLSQGTYLVPTLIAPISVVQFSQAHPDLLPPMMATKAVGVIEAHKKSFRMAVEAGVKIAMGTDSGVGLHGENGKELQLMAENGMTSMQAIQASTSQAAQLLHLQDTLGTLEVGKLADVIIVNGDVLNDISKIANPANIQLVLKAGRAAKNLLEVSRI